MAAPDLVTLPLAVQPQRLADLFWGRLLPGLLVPLTEEAAAGGQAGRRFLRALLQGGVFLGTLAAVVDTTTALHDDPRGLGMIEGLGATVAVLWAGFHGLDWGTRELQAGFLARGRAGPAAVLPLLRKIGKVAWALLIVILFLDNLGLDMKALLAGLGVGGLAIALAGQKTMENLFGGVMLVLDQPVRVGDYCGFGERSGTVEEVGLRSIKIRTPDRTLISVPNGEFSQLQLENFAQRDRIRFQTQIDVFAYFKTADYEQFLVWRQELLLDLMRQVEQAGTGLAYPTQTHVVGKAGA